jgi:hypothetical protein
LTGRSKKMSAPVFTSCPLSWIGAHAVQCAVVALSGRNPPNGLSA